MKLTSKQIIETLTYAEIKNIPNLTKAMNRHIDISTSVDEVRDMVRNGVDGLVGDIMAFELGLTVEGFMPFYKKKKKRIKKDKYGPRFEGKTSKFRGVYRAKNNSKFQACITVLGVQNNLGSFETEIEAALAYNNIAKPLGRKLNEVGL